MLINSGISIERISIAGCWPLQKILTVLYIWTIGLFRLILKSLHSLPTLERHTKGI
jgi:hypothetical protein